MYNSAGVQSVLLLFDLQVASHAIVHDILLKS